MRVKSSKKRKMCWKCGNVQKLHAFSAIFQRKYNKELLYQLKHTSCLSPPTSYKPSILVFFFFIHSSETPVSSRTSTHSVWTRTQHCNSSKNSIWKQDWKYSFMDQTACQKSCDRFRKLKKRTKQREKRAFPWRFLKRKQEANKKGSNNLHSCCVRDKDKEARRCTSTKDEERRVTKTTKAGEEERYLKGSSELKAMEDINTKWRLNPNRDTWHQINSENGGAARQEDNAPLRGKGVVVTRGRGVDFLIMFYSGHVPDSNNLRRKSNFVPG